MRLLLRWAIDTLAVVVIVYLLDPHVVVTSILVALVVGVILGLVNAGARPLLVSLEMPLNPATLIGLVLVATFAVLELLNWALGTSFDVVSLFWALFATLAIAVVTTLINIAVGGDEAPARRL